MKAYVEAHGCTLNFGEAHEIEELLLSKGWELSGSSDGCDLAVLATCVVIETTERAMLKRISELSKSPRLIVTGCIATACREKAERTAPEAEFIAPADIDSLSRIIEGDARVRYRDSIPSRSFGIVPIANGCLGECAFCITRFARGRLKSRPVTRIVESISEMSKGGPKEIRLTAQDTAAYGADIGSDLLSLVEEACDVPRDFRLRVGMMNPRSALPMADRLAKMYKMEKVFKFLHLPIQSASDELLRSMDRGYTADDFRHIVSAVRKEIPQVTLSTDLIVGYPGETPAHHRMNVELISEIKPDILNVTRFSSRPGTKAASSKGQIVGWMAKGRSREITEVRFQVALERNRSWVGRKVRALATERGKKGSTILRTDEYKQVVGPSEMVLGEYYGVRIVDATPTYLIAESRGDG